MWNLSGDSMPHVMILYFNWIYKYYKYDGGGTWVILFVK